MSDEPALARGDQVPRFEVMAVEGRKFSYSTIWQRRNLLLVLLSASDVDGEYVATLCAHEVEFRQFQAECVVTRDPIPGLRSPAVLLADRWGEVVHIASASESVRLPPVEELLDWLEYLQHRCPECEGEAR